MDDAELNLGFGEDGFDGFGKALQSIDAGDEDVLDSMILYFRDDLKLQFRALGLVEPEAEHIFVPGECNADG